MCLRRSRATHPCTEGLGTEHQSTPYVAPNGLVCSDRRRRPRGQPTEYQYIQSKHRTAVRAVTATSQAAVGTSTCLASAGASDVPGSHGTPHPRLSSRMGSGASKGAAPKGGKRKKNDPRAQLERLVQGGNVRGVADLLSKKTELTNSALDDKSGTRAIHIACKNGDKDMIRELMKRNCFLNQKDSKGCTALMLAAAAGHDKIVKLIVDSGADVRMKDRNDDTALEYAEKNNRTKVKELLNLYACEYTW